VLSSLAEISASNEEVGGFLTGVFDDLEGLVGDFLRQQKTLQSERQRIESDLKQERAELERQRAEVEALREGILADIRGEVSRATTSTASQDGLVEKVLADVEQERGALRAALAEAQIQLAQLAQTSSEIAGLRQEFKQWSEQQSRLQTEVLQARPAADPEVAAAAELERGALRAALADAQTQLAQVLQATADVAALRQEFKQWSEEQASVHAQALQSRPAPELEERLHRMEQERAALEQERAVLESELESVRGRAVEMAEMLEQQKRQVAEERSKWTGELQRFRQLMEMMSLARPEKRAAAPAAAPATAAPAARGPDRPASETAAGGDTALDSIIAQFELLQKDLARRRKRPAESP